MIRGQRVRSAIVRWPGRIPAGRAQSTPVSSVDFFPTLLDIGGVPSDPTRTLDGTSLLALWLRGEPPARESLFFYQPHPTKTGPGAAIRRGPLKLGHHFDRRDELYDLQSDPSENIDLAWRRPDEVRSLCAELVAWIDGVGAHRPRPNRLHVPGHPPMDRAQRFEWARQHAQPAAAPGVTDASDGSPAP